MVDLRWGDPLQRRWHRFLRLGPSPSGLSVLGPLLLLHQTTVCLFPAHGARWFICLCVPRAQRTAQHTAGVSVEWSWVARALWSRRSGTRTLVLPSTQTQTCGLRRCLPRKSAMPKVDHPPIRPRDYGESPGGSREKSPEEREREKAVASSSLWEQTELASDLCYMAHLPAAPGPPRTLHTPDFILCGTSAATLSG